MGNLISKIIKVILIILLIVTIVYLLLKLIEWLQDNKGSVYLRLKRLKEEIAGLIMERKRILVKMMRLELMAKMTLIAFKAIFVYAGYFLWCYLIDAHKYDSFTAFVTAGSVIGIAYTLIVSVFANRIYTINELMNLAQRIITRYYFSVAKVNPARLMEIDEQIVLKRKEKSLLKRNLRS